MFWNGKGSRKWDRFSVFFFIFLGANFFAVDLFFLGVSWVRWPSVPSPIRNAKPLKKWTKLERLQLPENIDGWHYWLYLRVSLIGLSCKIVSLVRLGVLVTAIAFSDWTMAFSGWTIAFLDWTMTFSGWTMTFSDWTMTFSGCTVGFSDFFDFLAFGTLALGPYLVVFFLGFLFLQGANRLLKKIKQWWCNQPINEMKNKNGTFSLSH